MDWPLVFIKNVDVHPLLAKNKGKKCSKNKGKKRSQGYYWILIFIQPCSATFQHFSSRGNSLYQVPGIHSLQRLWDKKAHSQFHICCSVIWRVIAFLQLAVRIINSLFSCVFKPPWSRVLFLSVRQLFCSMFLISLHLCLQYCYL